MGFGESGRSPESLDPHEVGRPLLFLQLACGDDTGENSRGPRRRWFLGLPGAFPRAWGAPEGSLASVLACPAAQSARCLNLFEKLCFGLSSLTRLVSVPSVHCVSPPSPLECPGTSGPGLGAEHQPSLELGLRGPSQPFSGIRLCPVAGTQPCLPGGQEGHASLVHSAPGAAPLQPLPCGAGSTPPTPPHTQAPPRTDTRLPGQPHMGRSLSRIPMVSLLGPVPSSPEVRVWERPGRPWEFPCHLHLPPPHPRPAARQPRCFLLCI